MKLFIVMVVVPIIGNAIQFWVIDTTLKKKKFEGQTDSVIRDSYFTARADAEPLMVQQVPSINKSSFIVERVYYDKDKKNNRPRS